MRSIFHLVIAFLFVTLPHVKAAPARYSSDWVAITPPEVQNRVKAAAGRADANELYALWYRARTQKQHWVYAVALRGIVQQQPRNASALATYSLVLLDIMKSYSRAKNFMRAKQIYFGDDLTFQGIRARIKQAEKLDPKQWPIWVTKSQIVPFPGGADITYEAMGSQSETFARHAIALKDNSFTNSALAYALSSRASWESKPSFYNQAITAASRAAQMQPVSVQAKAFLLGLYRDRKNDFNKARQVKKDIAATIPPNIKISEAAKEYLEQLGIT